jgi:hypothetical protein
MCVFSRARDVIRKDSVSREPPLEFHSVPPLGVLHSSDVRLWSLSQQHYRVPLFIKRSDVPHGLVSVLQTEH